MTELDPIEPDPQGAPVVTGADGSYAIERLPEGIYEISAGADGYATNRAAGSVVTSANESVQTAILNPPGPGRTAPRSRAWTCPGRRRARSVSSSSARAGNPGA